jgi:tetratricopeptide (TPR) repeat protein
MTNKFKQKQHIKKNQKIPLTNPVVDFNLYQFLLKNINYFSGFFILIFIIYLNAFDNAFVSDDILGTQKNPVFLDFSNLLSPTYWSYIPYFIFFKLGLTTPFYFRAINLFLHFGSTCLVFIILNITTKKKPLALITALLFAAHPILIESVTWISGKPYSQYAFFFLASFLFYLRSTQSKENGRRFFLSSVLCFFLTLLSSEKAVALFAIFPLYELAFGNLKKNWKKLWPFLFLTVSFAIIYLSRTGQVMNTLATQYYNPPSEKFYNPLIQVPIVISSYLGLIFWPQGLSLYHSEMSFSTGTYLLCLLVFLVFFGLIFYGWKKNRFLFFWLTFFFISLLPTLTPLKVSWIVAERYVYIGTVGILAVCAYFFNWLLEKFPTKKIWLSSFFILIISALSVRTIIRNIDWDNEDNLWIATAKTSPSGFVIHNNLGDVYARQNNPEKAIAEFKKALEINPGYADAFHNLANTYQAVGNTQEAIINYQKAAEINPRLWQSYQNLASIYFMQKEFAKAYELIKKALEINPTNTSLQENLKLIEQKL